MADRGTGAVRLGTHQKVAFTGTAGAVANAVSAGTRVVRVLATSACFIKIGGSPTATNTDVPLAANFPEYFCINPGEKISAIQQSAGGDLHVTECS